MRLYRVYTENKNYDAVIKLARQYFPKGFTVCTGEGYFQDNGSIVHEHSLIIEVVRVDGGQHVYDFAWDVKKENAQDSILVVGIPCDTEFV